MDKDQFPHPLERNHTKNESTKIISEIHKNKLSKPLNLNNLPPINSQKRKKIYSDYKKNAKFYKNQIFDINKIKIIKSKILIKIITFNN